MKLLTSIFISAFYGVTIRLLFAAFGDLLQVMSISFFFIVPFLIGYLTIFLLPYKDEHTITGAYFKPWLTCFLILIITCAFGIEGTICWVMAFPIFAIIAGCGGILAFNRKRRRALRKTKFDFDKEDWERPGTLKTSLLFLVPIIAGLAEGESMATFENLSVQRQIEINASPDAVWNALTAPHETIVKTHHASLPSLLGFPRHLSTTLDKAETGGQRIAAYQKGLTFVETIHALEPSRRLALTITTDASMISKAIMDEHIVIGGKHIRMQEDEYILIPLPDGNTRLSLTSRFSISTSFNWYARLWADWLMSDVITEELESLAASTNHNKISFRLP